MGRSTSTETMSYILLFLVCVQLSFVKEGDLVTDCYWSRKDTIICEALLFKGEVGISGTISLQGWESNKYGPGAYVL
jgi:hypothetical protein